MSQTPDLNLAASGAYLVALDQFDAAWASTSPRTIDNVLEENFHLDRSHRRLLLMDLVVIDMERRWRWIARKASVSSDPVTIESYLGQFPELATDQTDLLHLLEEEYRCRRRGGNHPSHEEYAERFPEIVAELINVLSQVDADFRAREPASLSKESGWAALAVLPARIGGHEVLGELGRGAMGVVYEARHCTLKRRVALKLILDGTYTSPEGLERFRTEAQAIARLDHPQIVRIHEIGEYDGRPFLVLEYLSGGTLESLIASTPQPHRQAAEIIAQLARAVEHAHRQGVIHRDLKPSNVLLASDGTAKVADFGLAKILESDAVWTQSGMIVGTAAYMAPEQARGRTSEIGPVADVYALGVILYEMITGRPPFLAATVDEVLELVKSAEPVPPRQLQPRTPRDLETICLKCLQKRPEWRYSSAIALADDLGRFLRDEPIVARPPRRAERFVRWCRREPLKAAFMSLAGLFVLTLLIGVPILGVLYTRAESQRLQAKTNLRRTLDVVDSLLSRVGEKSLASVPQFEEPRRGILLEALGFCQTFLKENSSDPDVQLETARAYARVASIEDLLGNSVKAEQANLQAIELQRNLLKNLPRQTEVHGDLAHSYGRLGSLYDTLGRYDAAEQLYQNAFDTWSSIDKLEGSDPGVGRTEKAQALGHLGTLYRRTNRYMEAERAFRDAISIGDRSAKSGSTRSIEPWIMAAIQHNLGNLLDDLGRQRDAETEYLEGLRIREAIVAKSPENPQSQHHLVQSFISLGSLYRGMKQSDRSLDCYTKAIEAVTRLETDHPKVFDYISLSGLAHGNFANLLRDRKEFDRALEHYVEALRHYEMALVISPEHAETRRYLLLCCRGWTKTLVALGRHRDAVALWDRALRLDNGSNAGQMRLFRGYTLAHLGNFQAALNDANAIYDSQDVSFEQTYNLACVYSMTIPSMRKDDQGRTQELEELIKDSSTRALTLLAKARSADPQRFTRSKGDPDLNSLRDLAEFDRLYHPLSNISESK